MGANVADYKVIQTGKFTLRADIPEGPQEKLFEFTLPGGTIQDQPSIISFMVLDTTDAKLRISINEHIVFPDVSLGTEAVDRCYQQVCGSNILKNGSGNRMSFHVEPGGTCKVSNVVLWFQNHS